MAKSTKKVTIAPTEEMATKPKGIELEGPDLSELHRTLQSIPLDLIDINPDKEMRHFDKEELTDLSTSIRETGLMYPIQVRKKRGRRYEVITGGRRLRATQRIRGASHIPAFVLSVDDEQALVMQFTENALRQNLNAVEMGWAISSLCETLNWLYNGKPNISKFSAKTGYAESTVREYLSLIEAPAPILAGIMNGMPKMIGVYIGRLEQGTLQIAAMHYVLAMRYPTAGQVRAFCSKIAPMIPSTETPTGKLPINVHEALLEALEETLLNDHGEKLLKLMRKTADARLTELLEYLGLTGEPQDSSPDEQIGDAGPSDPVRKVAMEELGYLPAVPKGKNLAQVLERYIDLLTKANAGEHAEEYKFAAKVLGRLYNAVVLKQR